jgi:alkylation response protein AidB-like acyl-CoA dehydrogenase
MAIGLTEEHEALGAAVRGWAERHVTGDVVRAALDAATHGRREAAPLHSALAEQGLLGLHVPEDLGGQGGGLLDLAVAVEELGRSATPGCYLPTVLASAVLLAADSDGAGGAAKELLPGLADGSLTGAVFAGRAAARAPDTGHPGGSARPASGSYLGPDAGLTGTHGDAGLVISGTAGPVLGAAAADVIILPVATGSGEEWVAVDAADLAVTELPSMDPSRPVASVEAREVTVPGSRALTGLNGTDVLDLASVLFGAEAAGVAAWCVDAAAGYAKVREQFGRPIGQFQAVKHKCARMLVALEQARAVVWDAARALDEAAGGTGTGTGTGTEAGTEAEAGASAAEARLASAFAAVLAPDAAVSCAQDCIQVHGGIGYTWEHDAHIYYRRALTLRALTGSPERWAAHVATLALAGARREPGIDLPAEAGPLRERVQREVAEIAALPPEGQHRRLAERGLVMPHLPEPWGRDADPLEQVLIQQELRAAGVRPPVLSIGAWVVPSLVAYGTREQQDRFLPDALAGETVWCQLFSEPGAGSDLASLRMRAERADGGWKLTGQKIWTSLAHRAKWGICLARTDPDKPKHDGISYFLVDMSAPGIDVRPLTEMTGEKLFNEVFFDGVFVPDDCVLGEVNAGWKVARNTLANERVSLSSGGTAGLSTKELLDTAASTAASTAAASPDGDAAAGDGLDAAQREHIGRLLCEGQSIGMLALRVTLRQLRGSDPGAASSVRKLLGMEHAQHIAEACWSLLGARGATGGGATGGPEGWWGRMVLATRAMTIYGGTTEVQLNIIGERMLGLPRDP